MLRQGTKPEAKRTYTCCYYNSQKMGVCEEKWEQGFCLQASTNSTFFCYLTGLFQIMIQARLSFSSTESINTLLKCIF